MEVEAQVGLLELLTHVLGCQHEVVSVNPYHFEVFDLWTDINHFLSNFLVDADVGLPIIMNERGVFLDIKEIMHFWLD